MVSRITYAPFPLKRSLHDVVVNVLRLHVPPPEVSLCLYQQQLLLVFPVFPTAPQNYTLNHPEHSPNQLATLFMSHETHRCGHIPNFYVK